jgi:hypothetical protein
MSETYLTIGSDTGRTEINRRTFGYMETKVDYSTKYTNRKFTVSLERDKLDYYDFKIIDNHTKRGLICKVKRNKGFTGTCIPIGDVEIES